MSIGTHVKADNSDVPLDIEARPDTVTGASLQRAAEDCQSNLAHLCSNSVHRIRWVRGLEGSPGDHLLTPCQ